MAQRFQKLRVVTIALITSTLFPLSILHTGTESAAACGMAPNSPIVKTVWGETGAPIFEISLPETGESARKMFYSVSTLDKDVNKWSEWTSWVEINPPNPGAAVTLSPKVGTSDDVIGFSVYAQNYCGNSAQTISRRILSPHYEWQPKSLNIAEDLPLSLGKVAIEDLFAFGKYVPITVDSLIPSICSTDSSTVRFNSSGNCNLNVSFNNIAMSAPGGDIRVSINILPTPIVLPTVQEDRPDDIEGFQIHVVYVVVNGSPSKKYDETGDINNWLDLANSWMKRKIGKEFVFDTFGGAYDISKLMSKYTKDELDFTGVNKARNNPLKKLSDEFIAQNSQSLLGKNLLFIVDEKIAEKYCGLGNKPGNFTLALASEGQCWDPKIGYLAKATKFAEVSDTIAHEFIHNLGVSHTCVDPSDLMIGEGCEESFFSKTRIEKTLDTAKAQYVGASASGANILDFKVWRDGSGIRQVPVKGACFVGEPCQVSNGTWKKLSAPLQIQELVNGKWKTIKSFKGLKFGASTVIDASIVPTEKGFHYYREFVSATKSSRAYVGASITRNVLY